MGLLSVFYNVVFSRPGVVVDLAELFHALVGLALGRVHLLQLLRRERQGVVAVNGALAALPLGRDGLADVLGASAAGGNVHVPMDDEGQHHADGEDEHRIGQVRNVVHRVDALLREAFPAASSSLHAASSSHTQSISVSRSAI